MVRRAASLTFVLSLFAAPSIAGPQVPPPAPPQEVIVHAAKVIHIVSTYPSDASSVPGGSLMMKIVFDQPMEADSWSYTASDKGLFPSCLARPRLLADQKTFVLLCSVATNATYALQINADARFQSEAGRPAPSYVFSFKTTDPPTLGLHDALASAGLSDADDPIMGEAPGGSAVQSKARPSD